MDIKMNGSMGIEKIKSTSAFGDIDEENNHVILLIEKNMIKSILDIFESIKGNELISSVNINCKASFDIVKKTNFGDYSDSIEAIDDIAIKKKVIVSLKCDGTLMGEIKWLTPACLLKLPYGQSEFKCVAKFGNVSDINERFSILGNKTTSETEYEGSKSENE